MYKVKQKDIITIKNIEENIANFHGNSAKQEEPMLLKKYERLVDFLKNKAEGRPLEIIFNRLFGFVDTFMETVVYPYSSCTKGCSNCCRVPVSVSALEMVNINQVTGKAVVMSSNIDTSGYCPFHDPDSATCSIFSARPLECRSFASMDGHEPCEDVTESHFIFNVRQSAVLKKLNGWLIFQSKAVSKQNDIPESADVRYWFGN